MYGIGRCRWKGQVTGKGTRESGLGRPMGLVNGGGMGVTGEEEGTRPERVGGEIADNKSRAIGLKVITLH